MKNSGMTTLNRTERLRNGIPETWLSHPGGSPALNNNNSRHSKGIKKLFSVNIFIAFVAIFGRYQFSNWLIAERTIVPRALFTL